MYKNILIATDGSDLAKRGVDHGLSLAKNLAANVTLVTVTERFPYVAPMDGWVPSGADLSAYEESQKQAAEETLAEAKAAADKLGVPAVTKHIPDAHPATAIVELAKSGDFSLIVMASHGRRGLGRLLLGSQTSEVLVNSPVPVLVIR